MFVSLLPRTTFLSIDPISLSVCKSKASAVGAHTRTRAGGNAATHPLPPFPRQTRASLPSKPLGLPASFRGQAVPPFDSLRHLCCLPDDGDGNDGPTSLAVSGITCVRATLETCDERILIFQPSDRLQHGLSRKQFDTTILPKKDSKNVADERQAWIDFLLWSCQRQSARYVGKQLISSIFFFSPFFIDPIIT